MTVQFALPDLGEGLADAEIVSWLVDVGDEVRIDQPLVEVETAKATVEIPSPIAGSVLRLGGAVGDVIAVGGLLVELSGDGVAATEPRDQTATVAPTPPAVSPSAVSPSAVSPSAVSPSAVSPSAVSPSAVSPTGAAGRRPRVLASPSTRARATALGLDLATITGSGPGGRITREDVERSARTTPADASAMAPPADAREAGGTSPNEPSAPPAPPADEQDRDVPLRGIRREIARTMTASWQQIPHVTEFREIDATELTRVHRALRERRTADLPRLTLLPLLALASVAAIRHHPMLNASLDMRNETVRYHGAVHLGIATATPDGLMVPVVRDAQRMGLSELTSAIDKAIQAARAHRAEPGQLVGGTVTISNFGSYGTWLGTPVINPPQAAVVGFGRVRDAVVAVEGQPVVRPTLPVAVSADHRLVDGDVLGAFVGELSSLLTDPALLLGER